MNLVNVDVDVNIGRLQDKINYLCTDETTMLEIHNALARFCDPYVPFLEGPLSQSGLAQVSAEYVQYGGEESSVPYARYQYYGTDFNHTLDYHPLASAKWDEAMMRDRGDEFTQQVENILKRRAKKLWRQWTKIRPS